MKVRPTGTVTFLFTDIEGSTRLWEEHPVAMRAALARHDVLVRGAISIHDGTVFSTGGDGVAAVFARADAAVDAAVALQRALADEPWSEAVLRVRVGLHTGEAEERNGDFFGVALNRAARLMASTDGGRVVMSLATAEIVRSDLRSDLDLVDLGEHDLRSLSHPERLFELTWPGSLVPAAGFVRVSAGNLAQVVRPLLGRDTQITALCSLVAERPLVTLTGVGGAGKTSLALAVARQTADDYKDGIWFCDLAAVLQPDEVITVVSETLGLRPQAGVTVADGVLHALAQQRCLLVLDNCEHVLDAAALVAEAVGARCPGVKVLATSREGLGVAGEQLVAVRPLERADAIRLFYVRVAEHDAGFTPTESDDALVAELCERLDGLPLAIELAAARVRSMTLVDLTSRLGERFRLLRGQRRGADRHQTLRATVAWSYGLLNGHEQRLFDRLSVFTGGFTLAAAEAVCTDGEYDTVEVDELVVTLADKSMIVAEATGRYRLLETLRQFGEEQLAEKDEPERLRRAHLDWFTQYAVSCHDGLQGPDQAQWWQRMNDDWANLRAAFGWARLDGDVTAAATLATHLVWAAMWHDVSEPYLWISEVATMQGADCSALHQDILACQAWVAWEYGQLDIAVELGLQALAAETGTKANIDYFAEFAIYSAAFFKSDLPMTERYLDQVVERARSHGRHVHEAIFRASYSIIECELERYEQAVEAARNANDVAARTGNPNATAWALYWQGFALAALGEPAATTVFEQSILLGQQTGSTFVAASGRSALASELLKRGHLQDAIPIVLAELQTLRQRSAPMFLQQKLIGIAMTLGAIGSAEDSAVLYGATHRSAAAGPAQAAAELDELSKDLATRLDDDILTRLITSGEQLTPEQAATIAATALAELLPK